MVQEASGPPGLDLAALRGYLDRAAPDLLTGALTAEVIAGGRSNLTYVVSDEHSRVVLRRPPLGHVLPTAHDMGREFRVIAALHPTGFPVPRPLHLCPAAADGPLGVSFYLMSYVDGIVLRGRAEFERLDPVAAGRVSELLVETLARLHALDPAAIGLADFGHPEGYLERQVRRWHQQWQRSQTRELPGLAALTAALGASVPRTGCSAIVHGDYRLDNVMVDRAATAILAVLDWEMATLGDPLADLGLLVVYTELAAEGLAPTQPQYGPAEGFLAVADLVQRYAVCSGATVDAISWYVALGYYKLAIISEGIHARFLQGKTVGEGFERMGRSVPLLVDRARAALADPV
ncbi:MAG: phosphotransferase family protein [Micromonosporaceae bacterium]